jgi:hypothetical protein
MVHKKWIWVKFQKVGFHYYEAAGVDINLSDVSYLANRHRHLFKFNVKIEVFHDDREIEFHQFLNYCEEAFSTSMIDISHKSVEMLADDLHNHIKIRYSGRDIIIDVSEDGECGCSVEYPKA